MFTDVSVPGMNYIWITTAGQEFEEGQLYDISGECDARGILKRVRMIKKSEQPDHKIKMQIKPDALDVLLGQADYTTHLI